jgi:2-keto-4-pentenoate hydratase
MVFDPVPAAEALRRIRQDRIVVPVLPADIAPTTEAEGAAVQYALAELAKAVPPYGFKIGATGKRMQVYLGVTAPIAGFMRAEDVYLGHASLRFADYIKPGVECEVAVRLARDLPPGPCSLEQAMAAVGEFFAAIEIVENRYGELRELGTPTLLADQMYHCAAVIGESGGVDWRDLKVGALRGRISLDDGTSDEGVTTDLLGHPLNGLAWLAGSAEAAAFGGLKAGQVVLLGSVTPPVWLSGPATATVTFAPLPPVTVRFDGTGE